MTTTGFLYHEDCLQHDTGPGHPERPARLQAILEHLQADGVLAELEQVEPTEIDLGLVRSVHSESHVDLVERGCNAAPAYLDAGDTPVSSGSFRAARLSAGAVTQAVEKVLAREWSNAFVCCRPPGHHAERTSPMGFCLFNNIAIAASTLLQNEEIERVAIVDFDVHHGNGTQHLFEDRADVFFASLHQWPHYPGTGAAEERGTGDGVGATLNCPLSAGTADREWIRTMEDKVLPQLEQFRPDFLLVSAGFDGHELDPLSGTRLTAAGYQKLTARLRQVADAHCGGRLISVLEGGYSLEGLAQSVNAHVKQLRA